MVKLTKSFIDRVKPPASAYEMHWDDSVRGFGLRVTSSGKRVFMVMGRVKGKQVQFTIGNYGTYTEDVARKKAQKVLQQMREGIAADDMIALVAALRAWEHDGTWEGAGVIT